MIRLKLWKTDKYWWHTFVHSNDELHWSKEYEDAILAPKKAFEDYNFLVHYNPKLLLVVSSDDYPIQAITHIPKWIKKGHEWIEPVKPC